MPRIEPTRDREKRWRHPDVRAPIAQLRRAAHYFDVPVDRLTAATLAKQYRRLPLDFLAWECPPFPRVPVDPIRQPELQINWCSRCLAEDFAEGRPAHIRAQWVFAAKTFCHHHRWPLVERCGACGSCTWKFAAPARGPLRMICRDCWRPLEQSRASLFELEVEACASWRYLISFEAEIQTALRGRTPDQALLNETSARQLLALVRDLSRFLLRNRRGYTSSSIALNCLTCDAMAAGENTPMYRANHAEFPLATAGLIQRRSILAAAFAIIDPRREVNAAFFGEDGHPAIEKFIEIVGPDLLERHMDSADWPSGLMRRIRQTRAETSRRRVLDKLRRRLTSLERGIAALKADEAVPFERTQKAPSFADS